MNPTQLEQPLRALDGSLNAIDRNQHQLARRRGLRGAGKFVVGTGRSDRQNAASRVHENAQIELFMGLVSLFSGTAIVIFRREHLENSLDTVLCLKSP